MDRICNKALWDRLLLLLVSEPKPGFEREFDALVQREVDRAAPAVVGERKCDE